MSAPTPARKVAYEVLRRVFEHGAWADRAFRSAAERHGISGRERAQAQHLRPARPYQSPPVFSIQKANGFWLLGTIFLA